MRDFFKDIAGDIRNWLVGAVMGGIVLVMYPLVSAFIKAVRAQPIPWTIFVSMVSIGIVLSATAIVMLRRFRPKADSDSSIYADLVGGAIHHAHEVVADNYVETSRRPFIGATSNEDLEMRENFHRALLFESPQPPVSALTRLRKFRNQGLSTLDSFSDEHPTMESVESWWQQSIGAAEANALKDYVKLGDISQLKDGEVDATEAMRLLAKIADSGQTWPSNMERCELFTDLWCKVERINNLIDAIES